MLSNIGDCPLYLVHVDKGSQRENVCGLRGDQTQKAPLVGTPFVNFGSGGGLSLTMTPNSSLYSQPPASPVPVRSLVHSTSEDSGLIRACKYS